MFKKACLGFFAVVALVLAASVVIYAARTDSRLPGFVLHQQAYYHDVNGVARLNFTAEIHYSPDGSYYEVKRYTDGVVHRDLKSAKDRTWYRVTKTRVYRMGGYTPHAGEVFHGDPVEVAGVAAVRVQPKDDRTGKHYAIADVAPGLQNAIVGMRFFGEDGRLIDRIETVAVEYKTPPAELFKLPQGVPVGNAPPLEHEEN